MATCPLFQLDAETTDLAYRNLAKATEGQALAANEFACAPWEQYEPFADEQFLVEIRNAYDERFWEMHQTYALLSMGLTIECPCVGPKVLVHAEERCIWVEAICPGPLASPSC